MGSTAPLAFTPLGAKGLNLFFYIKFPYIFKIGFQTDPPKPGVDISQLVLCLSIVLNLSNTIIFQLALEFNIFQLIKNKSPNSNPIIKNILVLQYCLINLYDIIEKVFLQCFPLHSWQLVTPN